MSGFTLYRGFEEWDPRHRRRLTPHDHLDCTYSEPPPRPKHVPPTLLVPVVRRSVHSSCRVLPPFSVSHDCFHPTPLHPLCVSSGLGRSTLCVYTDLAHRDLCDYPDEVLLRTTTLRSLPQDHYRNRGFTFTIWSLLVKVTQHPLT